MDGFGIKPGGLEHLSDESLTEKFCQLWIGEPHEREAFVEMIRFSIVTYNI